MKVYAPRLGGEVERVTIIYCELCDKEFTIDDLRSECPGCGALTNSFRHEYKAVENGR